MKTDRSTMASAVALALTLLMLATPGFAGVPFLRGELVTFEGSTIVRVNPQDWSEVVHEEAAAMYQGELIEYTFTPWGSSPDRDGSILLAGFGLLDPDDINSVFSGVVRVNRESGGSQAEQTLLIAVTPGSDSGGQVWDVAVTPDGQLFVARGTTSPEIWRFDSQAGELESSPFSSGGLLTPGFPKIAIGPDGELYASLGIPANRILHIDSATGAQTDVTPQFAFDNIRDLAFTQPGELLVLDKLPLPSSSGRVLSVDALGNIETISSGGHFAVVQSLEVLPAGDLIVANHDEFVRVAIDTGVQDVSPTGVGAIAAAVVRAQCEDDLDNEGDGLVDELDPECLASNGAYQKAHHSEVNAPSCGVGNLGLAVLLPLLVWLRRRHA